MGWGGRTKHQPIGAWSWRREGDGEGEVRQNETVFKWDKKRRRAAQLVAAGALSDERIADELRIGRATLFRWREHPDFAAEVSRIVADTAAALKRKGIAEKQNRLDALNDRHDRMRRVIQARATEYADVKTGGETGLLVRQVKGIGKGADFQVIEEYAVDTALLREMRETEKQMAVELGQWTEKTALTDPTGTKQYDPSTDDERAARIAAIFERARARRDGQNSSGDSAESE